MKTKHWIALLLATAGLAIAADYTVPKVWTRTGAEYARSATLIFNPLETDVPVEARVRVRTVPTSDDRIDVWTAASVAALPDIITVAGLPVTNLFKTRMTALFSRVDIVRAYNWSLVAGREASMLPVPPDPEIP